MNFAPFTDFGPRQVDAGIKEAEQLKGPLGDKINDRCRKVDSVQAVKDTSVAGHDFARVLDPTGPLEKGLK